MGVINALAASLCGAELERHTDRMLAFASAGIRAPTPVPDHTLSASGGPQFQVDHEIVRALSTLVVQENLPLADTIRLWRGQSTACPHPNKAFLLEHLSWLLHDYDQRALLLDVVQSGVKHRFQPPRERGLPRRSQRNHDSATVMQNALLRSVRAGQDNETYLVVDVAAARVWSELHYSPFGCVPKTDCDPNLEARVIHDLSFPRGDSTNDWSDQDSIPALTYEHVAAIARRILQLRDRHPDVTIKIMKGDVKSAFRHIHVHESVSPYFTGAVPDQGLVVIDLALPFGWTGSPAYYGVFGRAVSFLVRRESPHSLNPQDDDTDRFFCYDWVDDHVLVEPELGARLRSADLALRLSMTAVLGLRAINENKFMQWSTTLIALGLEWDTTTLTASMPEAKITKALQRVQARRSTTTTTRLHLSQLLGSLHHV